MSVSGQTEQRGCPLYVFLFPVAQHFRRAVHLAVERARNALVDQAAQLVRSDGRELKAGPAADILEEAVHLDVIAHADDRHALPCREHQRVQANAHDGFHARENADGRLDRLADADRVPRAVQQRAHALGLKNVSAFVAHKNMPKALEVIVSDPELKIDALILPGHVSTIIGTKPYEFLAEKYGIPGVITGFEPVDVLQGIAMIMRQLHEGRAEIEIAYSRGVMREGNPVALAAIDEVFDTVDATWRGLGVIPGSGYAIREEFEDFDAVKRFHPEVEPTQNPKGCRCGDVLRGIMAPDECPLFRKVCTPENPVGPCMVSSEGSCAAYYRYY